MKQHKYRITSQRLQGQIVAVYYDDRLHSILFNLQEPLDPKQAQALLGNFPYQRNQVGNLEQLNLQVEQMGTVATAARTAAGSELKPNEKIALFCEYYLGYTQGKEKYQVSKSEPGMVNRVEMSERLLQVYFTSDTFIFRNKSVANYVRYYNELRTEAAGVATVPQGKKYPKGWNRDFERTLGPREALEYHRYLLQNGWEPKHTPGAGTVWIEKQKTPHVQ